MPGPTEPPASAPAHVALIGLMGSGKSTIGRVVAAELGRPLVDVDERIEARTGMAVRELWERGGEAAYRPLERDEVMAVLADDGPDVLAVPAGAVVDDLVRAGLDHAGALVVWLRVDVDELVDRVTVGDHRPLLGDDPRGVLVGQATEREDTYRSVADLVVDAGSATPEHVASVIVAAVRAAAG